MKNMNVSTMKWFRTLVLGAAGVELLRMIYIAMRDYIEASGVWTDLALVKLFSSLGFVIICVVIAFVMSYKIKNKATE